LRRIFHWKPDRIQQDGEMLAFKYHGYCKPNRTVRGEYQIVSMLTGLFWEVEHSKMSYTRLRAFEEEFENLLPAR